MTKNDLIKKLSEKIKIPPRAAKAIVDTIFDSMKESLEKGEGIEIRGIGSFTVRKYGGYKGRNPKTGQTIQLPSMNTVGFIASKGIKKSVRK